VRHPDPAPADLNLLTQLLGRRAKVREGETEMLVMIDDPIRRARQEAVP
jgi:hypothetical protein